ncbi:hypothetical protein B0H16DRAFT_1737860 [Mycena metata]|uniref:Uncharacterized protein n=1 Tax=Mycena metata TaxID=1033252 RepID=A0AAD7HK55_9AGAR|nr:hypothetical protein B0H16DRAFT_1737860 [Mycena metata]
MSCEMSPCPPTTAVPPVPTPWMFAQGANFTAFAFSAGTPPYCAGTSLFLPGTSLFDPGTKLVPPSQRDSRPFPEIARRRPAITTLPSSSIPPPPTSSIRLVPSAPSVAPPPSPARRYRSLLPPVSVRCHARPAPARSSLRDAALRPPALSTCPLFPPTSPPHALPFLSRPTYARRCAPPPSNVHSPSHVLSRPQPVIGFVLHPHPLRPTGNPRSARHANRRPLPTSALETALSTPVASGKIKIL